MGANNWKRGLTRSRSIARLADERARTVADEAIATGTAPSAETLGEIERLSRLSGELQRLGPISRSTKLITVALVLVISAIVAASVAFRLSEVRIDLDATTTDLVVWLRYQEVLTNLDISSMTIGTVKLTTSGLDQPRIGTVLMTGGQIRPHPYTGEAEGYIAVHFDEKTKNP